MNNSVENDVSMEPPIPVDTIDRNGGLQHTEEESSKQDNISSAIEQGSDHDEDSWLKSLDDDWLFRLKDEHLDAAATKEWQTGFKRALKRYEGAATLPDVLNIFSTLVEPLRSRFLYHFGSSRQTNRLDKPEWFLQHIIGLAEQYSDFLIQQIQPLLDEALPNHRLRATHEFIRALLTIAAPKVKQNGQQLLNDIELLRHMIQETTKFDETLRTDFGFRNRDLSIWAGMIAELLNEDVFQTWLSHEDEFVKVRYHEIIDENEVFEITNELEAAGCEIAANPSALKMIDLFEALTRQFQPVENLEQRRRFVETIQITLLNSYLERIRESTDAFDELVNGFSGAFPSNDVAGVAGLQRLCRQLSGVANVQDKLQDWINEPYYIDLDEGNSHCFSEVLQDYILLRQRVERLIVAHLNHELTQELRPYARLHTWSSDEVPASKIATSNASSVQLIKFYEMTTNLFSYLVTISSPVFIHKIYVQLARRLDDYLWSNVVYKNKFSRRGALQFKRDILQLWYTFSPYVARPEAGLRRMNDVLALLTDGSDVAEKTILDKVGRVENLTSLRGAGIATLSIADARLVLNSRLFTVVS